MPYGEEVFSFKGPFKKISMFDAILEHNPQFTAENVGDREFLAQFVKDELKEQVKPSFGLGKLQTIVFEETVETQLRQPTFITEYPLKRRLWLVVMMIIRILQTASSSLSGA